MIIFYLIFLLFLVRIFASKKSEKTSGFLTLKTDNQRPDLFKEMGIK